MDIVAQTAPEATLIAHIGSLNEAEATALAAHAEKTGYDAISSVAPYYYKFTPDEIRGYYFRLAESVNIPMLVYHFPAFSGVSMGVEEMSKFLDCDRFLGIKYTSNDFFMLEQCKTRYPDKIVYNGYDEMFLAGLSMGADGGIGSTYNFMADKFVTIKKLYEEGKMAEAKAVQQEANRIITILCKLGVMQTEKEVLNQLGLDFGTCRPPFAPLTDEQKDIVAREIVPFVTGV
jgi:N-acetylneuraminate lyase